MIARDSYRGLNSTIEEDSHLQKHLVNQFEKRDPREMMKAFLGQIPEEGTTSGEIAYTPSPEIREAPMLWVTPSIFEETSIALQSWEGIVLAVKEEIFVARLKDHVSHSVDEEIEMPLGEVSEDDKELVVPGAIFYWCIGRETTASGQVKRTSVIKFRRLPSWSMRELVDAKKKAADISTLIGWGKKIERSAAG